MPSVRKRMGKVEMWPRPHDMTGSVSFELDDSLIDTTILPICHYDEGKGAPDSYNSHPEHASYVVAAESNCFVDSRINQIFCRLTASLTSKFIDDNLTAIRIGIMPIFLAFKEDYDATDELSGATVKSVLGMEYETTDRQGRPIYNASKMAEKFAGSNDLWDQTGLGLTTDVGMEGVSFNRGTFYDALQYMKIAGKLKKCVGGMKYFSLTQNRPYRNFDVKIRPKNKRMNEYNFLGVMLDVPTQSNPLQTPVATRDTTAATQYVDIDWATRYLEWHDNFDHGKV